MWGMRLVSGQSFRALALAVAAAHLAGCAAPPEGGAAPDGLSEGGPLLEPRNVTTLRESMFTDWLPEVGRMNASTRRRHLPPLSGWATVLAEEFDGASATVVPGWRIVGFPTLRPVRLDGTRGLELRGPVDMRVPCGFERDLDPALLAGRDARLDLRLTCRSFLRADALEGIRISLLARDRAGRSSVLTIPMERGVSPGWEWQRVWLRFRPDLEAARLRIWAERPGAVLTLDAVYLSAIDPLAHDKSQPAPLPRRNVAGQPLNLVAGGDFETGSTRFFTSATAHWPDGKDRTVPLSWHLADDAVVGANALVLSVADAVGRVGFGPLDLSRGPGAASGGPQTWHLSFYARAARPALMTVSLRTRSQRLGRVTYELATGWQRFTGRFRVVSRSFRERLESASAELIFEFAGDEAPEANECRLDAVVLAGAPIKSRYVRPAPVEVGLLGPAPDPADLSHLLDEQDAVSFTVRLVGDVRAFRKATAAASKPADEDGEGFPVGQLAVDVLDAWDRVVWSRTRPAVLPVGGVHNERVRLKLPRGYYRILATLWKGEPGESPRISRAALPLATLSLLDPVPSGNLFGLSSDDGNVSLLTTHLGAGWVRIVLPVRQLQVGPGIWDFSAWGALMGRCRQGRIEVVVDVELPQGPAARRSFVKAWLAERTLRPIGVVVRPPVIATRPAQEYLDQLNWLHQIFAPQMPGIRVVRELSVPGDAQDAALSGVPGSGEWVWGIASRETSLPEESEDYLDQIRRRRSPTTCVWDLGVPVRLGGMPEANLWPYRVAGAQTIGSAASSVIEQLAGPLDPVRSASRMVRAILIRALAGAEMVCCEANALSPVRSIHDDDHRRLHERDLSPRVALVAFDLAAQLLNDATLERWIDVPGGARVLLFAKDDGRAVAALWRPFGLAPTRLRFEDLPDSVRVIDCVGSAEPTVVENGRRIIEANEIVRYLIAPADQRAALRRSLDTVRVVLGPATQPGA